MDRVSPGTEEVLQDLLETRLPSVFPGATILSAIDESSEPACPLSFG